MKTAQKLKNQKALNGQSLFDYRMALLQKNSGKPLIVERGRNVWNIKPYKD
jgi:hypothetical protein